MESLTKLGDGQRSIGPPVEHTPVETRRRIETQKKADVKGARPADLGTLVFRVRNVAEAAEADEPDLLHAALVDVAATAERWANRVKVPARPSVIAEYQDAA